MILNISQKSFLLVNACVIVRFDYRQESTCSRCGTSLQQEQPFCLSPSGKPWLLAGSTVRAFTIIFMFYYIKRIGYNVHQQ